MKKTALTVFISGVFLVASLAQTGCIKQPASLAMNQGNPSYIVDTQSPDILVSDYDDVLYNTLESPAAGLEEEQKTIPPAIQYLLFSGRGSIGGFVWDDLNGNGVFDIGEPGLQGLTVFVDIDENGAQSIREPFDETDSGGNYDISHLKPGMHNIYVAPISFPTGYGFTTTHPLTISLERSQFIKDADFGIQNQSGAISGYVFNDSNQNSVQDVGEDGIGGAFLYWDLNGNDEYDPGEPMGVTEQNSGYYSITNLAAGTHKLHLIKSTLAEEYYQNTVSGQNPIEFALSTGDQLTVNFGYVRKVTITGFILSSEQVEAWGYVTVFIDLNGNGVYDEGEPTAETDENGMFIFTDLPPGTYTILIKQSEIPSGYNLPVTSVTVTLNEGETAYVNFLTEALPASIEGYVLDDVNGNGKQDITENGLENIRVFADQNRNGIFDPGELSTLSEADGFYSLTGLESGPNWIRVDESTLPGDYLLSTKNIPFYQIILPGGTFSAADFGYQAKLAVMHSNNYPTRIALRQGGGLYVSDTKSNSVFIYDGSLNLTGEIKNIAKPLGIASDSSDNIYIGSNFLNTIEMYNSSGDRIGSIGDGNIQTPNDLALDRDQRVYVVDSQGARVWVFNPDGTLHGTIGSPGIGPGQFTFPKALAITYQPGVPVEVGELYVADQATHLIQVFDLQGNFLRSFGGPIQTGMTGTIWEGLFSAIQSLAFDQAGMLHVLDMNLDVVQILDPVTGAFIDYYFAYLLANYGKLNLQLDLAINGDDDSIITNVATNSIEILEKTKTAPLP